MALTKPLSLENNFGDLTEFPEAYIKVEYLHVSKDLMNIHLCTYKNKGGLLLVVEDYITTPDFTNADNFIKQAYEYVKTLEAYQEAKDI